MLKHVSQFFLQIFPSVIATVVGAYIVNYYINPKTHDAPKASIASTPAPAQDAGAADTATAQPAADDSAKTKPSVEKTVAGKPAAEKAVVEKSAEAKRAKAAAKASPIVEKSAPPAEKPPVTVSIAPAEAPVSTDDKRDANDLARAALDRLRGPVEVPRKEAVAAPNPPASPRVQDQPRVTVASTPPQQPIQPQMQPQVQQQMQPLPPAVLITTPANTGSVSAAPVESQPRRQDRARLLPPADIPGAPPLDLHAPNHQSSITDDVVAKARSVIDKVISR